MSLASRSSRSGRTGILLLMAVWLLCAWGAHHEFLPYDVNNTDTGTYLFQARTFADGKLWRETPQPPEFFQQWQVIVRDHSHAYYPPAHAILLSLPLAWSLDPWIMPWLLSGFSLAVMFLWAHRLAGNDTSLLATCLLVLSPFFAANGASLLSHSSSLTLTLGFLLATIQWARKIHPLSVIFWALITGCCLFLVFATRPVNAAALGIVWIPWVLIQRGTRTVHRGEETFPSQILNLRSALFQERRAWIAFAAGAAIPLAALMGYYHELCGRWTTDLFTDYWPRNRFGFGTNLGRGEPGHFFQTYAHHDFAGMLANWMYVFKMLAIWWTGNSWVSLTLLITCILLLIFNRPTAPSPGSAFGCVSSSAPDLQTSRQSLALPFRIPCFALPVVLWILAHIFLYSLYYTPSTGFSGPRYLTELLPAFALLTAMLFLAAARSRPVFLLLLMALFAGSTVWFKSDFYASNARGSDSKRRVEQTVRTGAQSPALVFLRSFWIGHPYPIFLNNSSMHGPVLFACDRGEEDFRLVEKHPERNAYILAVTPQEKGRVQTELIQIYDGGQHRWIRNPATVSAPFFIGSRFTPPIELRGEIARQLFLPKPDEIVGQ